jgi:adenylylsulfate kinase
MIESRKRSVLKAVSWRCIASVITAVIVYVLTDQEVLAISAGLADSLIKIGAYYVHERAWGYVSFGKVLNPLANLRFVSGITDADRRIIREKLEELGYVIHN